MIDEKELLEEVNKITFDSQSMSGAEEAILVSDLQGIIEKLTNRKVCLSTDNLPIDNNTDIVLTLNQIKDTVVFKEFFNLGKVFISDNRNQVIFKLLNWYYKVRPDLFKQSTMWRIGPLERYMLAYTSKHDIEIVEFINIGTNQPMFKIMKSDGKFHYPDLNQEIIIKEVMSIENFVYLVNNQKVK